MPITVNRLRRLEVWTSWVSTGGTRVAVLSDALNRVVTSNIDGSDKLTFDIPLGSKNAALVVTGAFLRTDESDTAFDEWRVVSDVPDDSTGLISVTAAPFRATALVQCPPVTRTLSDGTVLQDFESVGLSPADQISTVVLPILAANGLSNVTLGVITPTAPMNLKMAWDSPLAVLQRIADQTQMELNLRRVGTTGYAIDIIEQIGSDAPTADIRAGKNLLRLVRSRSVQGQATRVYPKGASDGDDGSATMAEAAWLVTNVAGVGATTVLTLADPAGGDGPIAFDNQLLQSRGVYVRSQPGTLYGISACNAAAQTITLPIDLASTDFVVGSIVTFGLNAVGSYADDLTYLESPQDVIDYGVISGTVDQSDIPGHRNYVLNPSMRAWSGSLPDSWAAVGSAALAKQTAAPYIQNALPSLKATTADDGTGITTAAVPIFPTADNPYVSAFADVWVASGGVRVELVFTTPSGTKVLPAPPDVASNSQLGQFDPLGADGTDAHAIGATAVAVRVVQNGSAASVFYVAAAQITLSAAQLPYVEGSGGVKLWQAANESLRTSGGATLSYESSLVDLAAIDPDTWGQDSTVTVGGGARIVSARLATAILTRIIEITRKYDVPGDMGSVTLSTKPDDLSGTLARRKRPNRVAPAVRDLAALPSITGVTASIRTDSHPVVTLIGSPDADTLKVAVSTSGFPTDAAVDASSPIAGNSAVVAFGAITVSPGQVLYGRAFAYRTAPGGATALKSNGISFQVPYAQLQRSNAFADGLYALVATDTAGLTAASGVTDSSGLASRKINLSLAKASSGAPDDLRSVPDGGGYNRTTSGYVDSTGRIIQVAPDGVVAGISAASLSRAQGTGVFSETFSDLGARNNWSVVSGSVAPYVQNEASAGLPPGFGPNCFVVVSPTWLVWIHPIPFDPTKLYKMTTRVSVGSYGGGSASQFIAGFVFYKGDGTTVINKAGVNAYTNLHYFSVFTSLAFTGNAWVTFAGFLRGIGAPIDNATDPTHPSGAPADAVYFAPIFICNFGGTSTAQMNVDSIDVTEYDPVASQLTYTGFNGAGSIAPSVTQGDAAGGRVMIRGRQTGRCRNGDAIVFSPPYQNTPIFNQRGGALNEPRPRWGPVGDGTESGAMAATPQYESFTASGLSASGCTALSRLRQKLSTASNVNDVWTGAHSLSLTVLSSAGGTTSTISPSSPPAVADTYAIDMSASISLVIDRDPGAPSVQKVGITMAVDVDLTGTGLWAEAGTYTFLKQASIDGTSAYSTTVNVTRSSITSSSKFRARVKSITNTSDDSSSMTVSADNLRYQHSTGTADQYASKTPDSDDYVEWEAYEASAT